MIAKLLHQCGLYLGEEKDMVPATPDNPDGHWEHTDIVHLNDELLGLWGGGWDRPPQFPADWHKQPKCKRIRDKARALIATFAARPAWGWKDPRTTLTFPFWNDLLPELKAVVCLRNPLEVARSLNRRRLCSYALGLDLWNVYTKSILTTTSPEKRIVTHYAAYFDNPTAEIEADARFSWHGGFGRGARRVRRGGQGQPSASSIHPASYERSGACPMENSLGLSAIVRRGEI